MTSTVIILVSMLIIGGLWYWICGRASTPCGVPTSVHDIVSAIKLHGARIVSFRHKGVTYNALIGSRWLGHYMAENCPALTQDGETVYLHAQIRNVVGSPRIAKVFPLHEVTDVKGLFPKKRA